LFTPNSIINEFIKSGLLFNENISVHTSINIESTKKDKIFNEAKLELRVLNSKISFDNSIFIINNIGFIEASNSDLFLENDKLFLTSNLSIDIKDTDRLFSFLNTNKKSRKNIKNIKLNIIYDFLSNEFAFKNIKIDDNEVSDQFNIIAEGFIDNNSNNLTKSRRLLNELINLYEG
jgi:elongation factor P--beta-lysine ligase